MIITANNLLTQAEILHHQSNVQIIDAIVHLCSISNIEIETAASLIKSNPVIKSRIQAEAEDLNFIKRGARLPF